MPEFARIAPEFWAAITATARRGVRAMRVEATVPRPDRTFTIGVTTTTPEVEPDGAPKRTGNLTGNSATEPPQKPPLAPPQHRPRGPGLRPPRFARQRLPLRPHHGDPRAE